MSSAFAQTMPPTEHFSQSRLTATIIALIALAFVLAAVFIYLQSGQRVQPPTAPSLYVTLSSEQVAQKQAAVDQAMNAGTVTLSPAQTVAKVKLLKQLQSH
jgi:hypothetical protein